MTDTKRKIQKLEAENKALKAEITERNTPTKGLPPKSHDRDLECFFWQYDGRGYHRGIQIQDGALPVA